MEFEKRGLKGGFLHLFDWTGKSRKKLFLKNSELPEGSKQGKENVENSAISRLCLTEVDDNGASSSNKGSSDYNCASSASSDEGYGTRAPGVVARLMGLNSLPTSNVCEPCSTPFIDSGSLGDAIYHRRNTHFQSEPHIMNYCNLCNRLEEFSRNLVKPAPQKMQSRPIERFLTETLPPKSAKSIPITHHKLLSPIKSHGSIPRKNAAYIMEAAAKIIEPGPRTATKGRMPSFGSSSVPLRIRDLKEKMKAAQKGSGASKPKETNAVKRMKGQSLNKNSSICDGLEDAPPFKASIDTGKSSSNSLKNKGKSVSLAIQAKVNVQRREGLAPSSSRSFISQKAHSEVKSNHYRKSQPVNQKDGQKRTSTNRSSIVLRQNNRKQNCVSNKDRLTSKTSVSNQETSTPLSTNNSFGLNKTVNKVILDSKNGSRKMGLLATETEKEFSSSKANGSSRKKRSIRGDIQVEERISANIVSNKDERSIKYNAAIDGCMNWGTDSRKNGMDVVSFTFTSPIKGSTPGSQSSGQAVERNDSFGVDSHDQNDQLNSKNSKSSSLGLNVIGGDALSTLLEQKLRELTYKIESSQCNLLETGPAASPASSLQDLVSNFNVVSITSMEHDSRVQVRMPKDKTDRQYDSDCSSIDDLGLEVNQKWQGFEGMEDHSCHSENSDAGIEIDCRLFSQASSLEPPCSNGSYYSSDSQNSYSTNGSQHFSLAQPHEVINSISTKEFQLMEGATGFSSSASSMTIGVMGRKPISTTPNLTDSMRSANWELEYVRDVLGNAELMVKDFALGQAHEVINPNLFDQLENPESGSEGNGEEYCKLERKVLFDFVNEYLDFRHGRLSIGSCKAWAEWATLFQRKGWLAEELYKEISGLRSMEDLMVDELVEKDMSTYYGRWLDFEIETFEEGVEIEKGILFFLVDELVDDLLL